MPVWLRRTLRISLWSALTVLTLYALLCAWLNWTGSHARERARLRLAAAGETLDFQKLLPPPVDAGRNFFEIPALKGISEIQEGDPSKGHPAELRKSLERMKPNLGNHAFVTISGVKTGVPVDITALASWLRTSKSIPFPATPGSSGHDVRLALEAAYPEIVEFAAAQKHRTEAEFVPSLAQRQLPASLFELAVPHYAPLMAATRAIQWHGLACAAISQGDAALQDARVLLRFTTACQREPLLISLLVAAAHQTVAQEIVWHVLQNRSAGEESLRIVQEEMSTSWEAPTLLALRGELAAAASTVQALERASGRERSLMLAAMTNAGTGNTSPSQNVLVRLLPRGFLALNGAHLIQSEIDTLVLPMKSGGLPGLLTKSREQGEVLSRIAKHPLRHFDAVLTRTMLPAVQGIAARIVSIETRRRQTVIACALERYYLQNQVYPSVLQDLVPKFLPELPIDITDGQPMRYRRTEAGRYCLWAVGFDQKDDGGKVTTSENTDNFSAMYKDSYKGDWPWQYEPVKQ